MKMETKENNHDTMFTKYENDRFYKRNERDTDYDKYDSEDENETKYNKYTAEMEDFISKKKTRRYQGTDYTVVLDKTSNHYALVDRDELNHYDRWADYPEDEFEYGPEDDFNYESTKQDFHKSPPGEVNLLESKQLPSSKDMKKKANLNVVLKSKKQQESLEDTTLSPKEVILSLPTPLPLKRSKALRNLKAGKSQVSQTGTGSGTHLPTRSVVPQQTNLPLTRRQRRRQQKQYVRSDDGLLELRTTPPKTKLEKKSISRSTRSNKVQARVSLTQQDILRIKTLLPTLEKSSRKTFTKE